MASNAIIDYLGNVLNSVKFAAIDVLSETMPNTKAFIENNKDTVKDIYNEVLTLKNTIARTLSLEENAGIFKSVNQIMANIKTDIRSGIFKHEERDDENLGDMMQGLMSMMGEAFGDMPDFDSMDDEEGPVDYTQQPQKLVTRGDLLVASSLFTTQEQATNCVGKLMTDLHEHNIHTQKSIYNMQNIHNTQAMNLHRAGYSQMVEGFNYIIKFNNEVMQAHIENSKKFFEEQLRLSTDSNAILKSIHSIHKAVNRDIIENNGEKPKEDTSDVDSVNFEELTKNGGFNYPKYKEIISKRWQQTPIKMMLGLLKSLPMMLQAYVSSPLHEAAKYMVKGLMGGPLTATLQHFDKFLVGAFQTGLVRLYDYGKENSESMLGKIASFFGVKPEREDIGWGLNTSAYDKSAMSWNGKAQKALVEVIPTYLSRIEAALSGTGERIFDYDKGNWTNREELEKQYKQIEENVNISAISNIRPYLDKQMSTLKATGVFSDDQINKIASGVTAGFQTLVQKGSLDYNHIKHNFEKYGNEYAPIFYMMMRNLPDDVQVNLTKDIIQANVSRNQQLKSLLKNDSSLVNLFNKSNQGEIKPFSQRFGVGISDLTQLTDIRGMTLYDYQYNILKELYTIRTQGGFSSSSNNLLFIISL